MTEQALAGVGEGTPLGTRFQSNLGVLLLERFMLYGRTQDIERASEALQRAVAATPSQHPNRTERIGALADAHRLQFERRWGIPRLTGHLDALRFSEASHDILSKILSPHARRELKKVVQTAEKAAKVTPAGHHLYARTRMRLAQAQALESVLLRDPRTMRRAHAVWAQVAGDATAAAPLRVRAARYLALAQLRDMMAGSRAADTSIGEFFDLAMELLPRAVPQALPHIDRERHLAMCAGVAHDAAAWVLRRDHPEPEQALGFLEQGRGVLHAQVLNKRTDLTELRARRPELARRFEKLARLLDRPEGAGFTSGWSLETGAASELLTGQDRHALASQWDQLVEEIRSVPGLEHFLQPFQVTELLSAGADEGPIIVINVSGLGCDALIIKDGGVRAVALPMLHAAELVKRADAFVADVRDAGNSKLPLAEQVTAQGRIVETLGWLWTAVTEPILDELGLLAGAAPHSESLPRLWWVPTGHLAYFPLHAAGLAGVPDAQVLDRVVSSYAPTVRELIHARSRPIPQRTPTALIIGMRRTPDAGELPRVPEEVQAITAHFPAARV
ncbi:CHAT domain-containing protein, partial [Streptomyces anulatus]|uniref:CHAT domain-containing protein n=1 Tax=Streptomyces anulatus TaxID=1892 RepID=UPI00342CB396